MKIELIPERVFSVQVEDKVLPGFRVVSEWEGFIKIQNADGKILIVTGSESRQSFPSIFSGIFGQDERQGVYVVSSSLDLLSELSACRPSAGNGKS